MEPQRRSMAQWLFWAGVAVLVVAIVGRVVWVIETKRRIQKQRELLFRLERAETELHLAWVEAEQRRQRAEQAMHRLHPGPRRGSWLCERVPCNDLPVMRPEDRTPRLLRAPTPVGDGPRPPERR